MINFINVGMITNFAAMSEQLTAISPIDGRYQKSVAKLSNYFSEYALFKYRVWVEVEYFIALADHKFFSLNAKDKTALRNLYKNFSVKDAQVIKDIESTTRHDVKAVEYFIKKKMSRLKLAAKSEWVHFGLTSQDINNTAVPLSWKEALHNEYLPGMAALIEQLRALSKKWKDVAMLARTHGQAASPTTLGKEIFVFVERIENQLVLLKAVPFAAKFGGATGNFNAHHVAFPKKNWTAFGNEFVNKRLGLFRSQFTTQIEHYDMLAAQFDTLKRINNILIDLSRDMWTYISMDYFKQQTKKGEVGSSAMPHKVNPIDFENAEGNLGMANATFEHLAAKLPISRLQRDLTDSTVLRNIGVPIAHSMIALNSLMRGLDKILLNEQKLQADLEANWAVVAEAIQTVLRREQFHQPYEALKDLTRGKDRITQEDIHSFIDKLKIKDAVKASLKKITPWNYVGVKHKF